MIEYTAKDASKLLGITEQQFYYRRREGRLPFKEIGEGKEKRYVMDEDKNIEDYSASSSRERLKDLKIGMEIKKIQQSLYEDRLKLAEQVMEIANREFVLPLLAELRNVVQPELPKLNPDTQDKWNKTIENGVREKAASCTEHLREMLLK